LALLILVGLGVEIVGVCVLAKSPLEAGITIVANLLIILGVWGELRFERRAREAGDGIVAEATARAAEADARAATAESEAAKARLELAKFRAPRTLTAEQQQQLREKTKPFAGTPFDMAIQNETEPASLMQLIGGILQSAGWVWQDWPEEGVISLRLSFTGSPCAGMIAATGIEIHMAESRKAEWGAAALALANTLVAAGIPVTSVNAFAGPKPDALHIRIGRKE